MVVRFIYKNKSSEEVTQCFDCFGKLEVSRERGELRGRIDCKDPHAPFHAIEFDCDIKLVGHEETFSIGRS